MRRPSRIFTGALVLLVSCISVALAQKEPTIKEIMQKAHKGTNSLLPELGKELKPASPNWTTVQKKTDELIVLATAMGKNDPPMGEKASWEKLTKSYLDNVKSLDKAVKEKNQAEAQKVHGVLIKSCTSCHKPHRPT